MIGALALILFAVLGLVGELLAATLTGHDSRAYATLSADAVITQGDQEFTLADYAARYAPVIRVSPTHLPPEATHIWYQAVAREDTIVLVYYLVWENEMHPDALVHQLYEAYRWAVYGSVRDIEYVELHIDQTTGVVRRMRFETASDGDYNRQRVTHYYAYADLNHTGDGYEYWVVNRENAIATDYTLIDGAWNADHRPELGVMTWNHLYTLLPDGEYGAYTQVINAPLRYLTDDVFRQENLARRSQGDLKVNPDNTLRNVLRVVFWGLSAFFAVYMAVRGLRS